ncbi:MULTISPECIES: hypothetical protein [Clostridia]|uniref:hypothetical protein n=1 Tax=Clostridia TaxID=186801 RepID=UPI00165247FA|nr:MULTISPECIES: hypothetical protein [Clostridia]
MRKKIKAVFPSKKGKVFIGAMTAGVVALVIVASVLVNASRSGNDRIKDGMPDFLMAEEKEEWKNKETDLNEIYIYINTYLEVEQDGTVSLRLANPPYCAYPIRVSICSTKNEEIVYYNSKILKPGESIEKVQLENVPKEPGNYPSTIQYSFYEDDGGKELMGEHTVSAELIIK